MWDIVADVDNETQYWYGTKSVKNISRNGNVIEREVVIAFKDSKTLQTVTLNPKKSVDTKISKGPITGSRIVTLTPDNNTRVDVAWDFKLGGLLGMFGGMLKKHIADGTVQALDGIAKAVE